MSQRTKNNILLIGLQIAAESGLEAVTFQSIAERAGTYRQAVGHYFANLDELRHAVESAAFVYRVIPVIAQALTGPRSARYTVTADTLRDVSAWIMSRGEVV